MAGLDSGDGSTFPLLGSDGYPPAPSHLPLSPRRPTLVRLSSRLILPAVSLIILSFVYFSLDPISKFREQPYPPPLLLEEWIHRNSSNVNVFEKLEISSRDGNAKASFFALGATLNEFYVRDRDGEMRDIVVGYRDPHSAATLNESTYAYFGSIVGRYANRISTASFLDPTSRVRYDLVTNEGNSTTLHGGKWGYSRSGWKVDKHDETEIVFSLIDQSAEGFPGTVQTTVTYSLLSSPVRFRQVFKTRVVSPLPLRTPVSLSSHVYWNLDGYQSEVGRGATGGGMKLWIEANRTVKVDQDLIPTGELEEIRRGEPLDFYSRGQERDLGEAIEDERSKGLCGQDCTGLDNALIYSNPERDHERDMVMTLSSPSSGIRMKVRTNQPLVHLYSCNSPLFSSTAATGAYPFKKSQNNGKGGNYGHWSCLAVEQEGWIDGLHHERDWGLEGDKSQWYDAERDYEWSSEYEFETF